ncbi:MAG: hypothetical protein HY042_05740 [Spirochaetia bacterium]|nr:hypothetical protein [Spirochaetia bacterium]
MADVINRNSLYARPTSETKELDFFDFDNTLADTDTDIPVREASGAMRQQDPKCFDLNAGDSPDYGVFDRSEMNRSAPIPAALRRLKQYASDKSTYTAVITARGQRHTFFSLYEYLGRQGAEVGSVFPLNTEMIQKDLWDRMQMPGGVSSIPSGMKKALIMAALIDLSHGARATPRLARYFEDTDSYLAGAMVFLPQRFPEMKFEFYDYIRTGPHGARSYEERYVAAAENGTVAPAVKGPFDPLSYSSGDCPVK